MPNQLDKQVIEEGPRNAVVRLTGVLQSNDVTAGQLSVLLSDFQNNDAAAGRLVGLRVDAVMYSMGVQIDALLAWRANTPQNILPLSRAGKIGVSGDGGLQPDLNRSGADGGIDLTTSGFPPGTTQNFTVVLRLVKLYKYNV